MEKGQQRSPDAGQLKEVFISRATGAESRSTLFITPAALAPEIVEPSK